MWLVYIPLSGDKKERKKEEIIYIKEKIRKIEIDISMQKAAREIYEEIKIQEKIHREKTSQGRYHKKEIPLAFIIEGGKN